MEQIFDWIVSIVKPNTMLLLIYVICTSIYVLPLGISCY